MAINLVELDSLEILVIVDNELDPISPCPNEAVQQFGTIRDIGLHGAHIASNRGGAKRELRMDGICCSAHGLSLMITGIKGDKKHTLLFDTGPEEHVWERNAKRLKADVGLIETIHLSHWHRDHSGGMLKAIQMIKDAQGSTNADLSVELHPARPDFRGFMAMEPVSMEADPTFEEITAAGGKVMKNTQAHAVLDEMFLISGEIPRQTAYEVGLKRGIRYDASKACWEEDTMIKDERFVMCKLKGMSTIDCAINETFAMLRMVSRQGHRRIHRL